MIEDMFSDKTKKAVVKVVDTGKVDLNKPKTFFDSSKGQNLFIVLSRLPKADTLLIALDNLNEKTVSTDNLQSLLKNWPGEEFDDLIRENDENPETKWDKTEAYFVTLGKKKKKERKKERKKGQSRVCVCVSAWEAAAAACARSNEQIWLCF